MRKDQFVGQLVRNRFRDPKFLQGWFDGARREARLRAKSRRSRKRAAGDYYVTGVHNGVFYRIKIPPKSKILPDIPKLRSPQSPPMPFVKPAAKPKSAGAGATAAGGEASSMAGGAAKKAGGAGISAGDRARDSARRFFERFRVWWEANWAVLLLNCGSVCTLIGFTRSDVLELRSLSVVGSFSSCVYLSVQKPFRMTPLAWSLTFMSVNAVKIFYILQGK